MLKADGAFTLFSKARADAVIYDLLTTAPPLWPSPPADRVCLANGVLNLDTGHLDDHGPDHWRATFGLPIALDAEADPTAPAWARYLDGVLPADAGAAWGFELIRWLMTPASGKRPALVLVGPGDGGKSTFLRLLRTVLGGDHGAAVSAASLQALTSDRFAVADLFGSVLNVCADLPAEPLSPAAVARFKEITGGDIVRAERKYGDGFTFAPFAHLVFSTNHAVTMKGPTDPAFWSRWLAVPFDSNRFERRTEADLRAELLAPGALSDLLVAVLACGDADGGAPEPTPSMRACLDSMRHGTRPPTEAAGGPGGDGAASEAIPPMPPALTDNFPNTEEMGHPPPVSQTGAVQKVVGDPWDTDDPRPEPVGR